MFAQEIGIDLGSANTVVVAKRKGIVAREPSIVAIDRKTREVVAVGTEAHSMIGRTPDTIISIRPVHSGVVSDLTHSSALLKHMMRKTMFTRWLRPRVLLTVPTNASAVDRRALAEAAVQAGASEVHLLQETVAAALGAGLPVDKPMGSLLVDIGSGTTQVAVISLGGVVVSALSTAAGDQMDEAIARYLKREHNLLIGSPTAERLKVEHGSALPGPRGTVLVPGRLISTGTPKMVEVPIADIHGAINETLCQIDQLLIQTLEKTPPELLADISHHGMTVTGGVALLHGIDERLRKVTGLPVAVAESPIEAVALGTSRVIDEHPRVQLYRIK